MNQFFAPLAEPVGAVWCLMAIGVVWLLCRRQWRGALWLGTPTILLFVIGSTPAVEKLVAAEERQWVVGEKAETGKQKAEIPPASQISTFNSQLSAFTAESPADVVVALGGGQRVSHHDVLGFAMEDAGSRMLTAMELVRTGKARVLVLGGSWPMPGNPDAPSIGAVQDWVTSWGLTDGVVTNLGICLNTHDEAVAFRKLARGQGWLKVMLVTSALHMRRSVAVFRKQGLVVTPVGADFQVQGVSQDVPFSPFPRQHRLFLMTLYMHEKIGWWFYRAKGWV